MKKIFVLVVSMILGVVGVSYASNDPFDVHEGEFGPKFFGIALGQPYDEDELVKTLDGKFSYDEIWFCSFFKDESDRITLRRIPIGNEKFKNGFGSVNAYKLKLKKEFTMDDIYSFITDDKISFINDGLFFKRGREKSMFSVEEFSGRIFRISFFAEAVGGKDLDINDFVSVVIQKLNLDTSKLFWEENKDLWGMSHRKYIYKDSDVGFKLTFVESFGGTFVKLEPIALKGKVDF